MPHVAGFDWDEGNINKNWEKHQVTHLECEEVFFNIPLIVKEDEAHSETEVRHFVLGKTEAGRLLFVVFAVRDKKIRIISARDMNRKERKVYGQIEKDTKIQE